MSTRKVNKLHIFQKKEIVKQTGERKKLAILNFHKKIKKLLKRIKQQKDSENLKE